MYSGLLDTREERWAQVQSVCDPADCTSRTLAANTTSASDISQRCHCGRCSLGTVTPTSCKDAVAWHLQARGGVADTLTEVSEFYSLAGPLSRRLADDSLAHWFAHLADQARSFDGCRITHSPKTANDALTKVRNRAPCGMLLRGLFVLAGRRSC